MSNLHVKDCMKSPVKTIQAENTIRDAANMMHANKIGSLLIEKDGKFDIITERDVLKAVAEDKLHYKLDVTMEDPLITIDQDAAIGEAAQIMLVKGFRRLLVTDKSATIVGIITVRDVVLAVHEAFLALFDL